MARSLLRSEQVIDSDFVSHAEHADSNEVPHYLTMNLDYPTTHSGHPGKLLRIKSDESGLEFVDQATIQSTHEFPRYYIESDLTIVINAYGQYTLNETQYIEVAGTLELGTGAMLIIK